MRAERVTALALAVALAWVAPCAAGDVGQAVTGQARSVQWLKDHALECGPASPVPSDEKPAAFRHLGSVEGKDVYYSQSSRAEQGLPNGSVVILEGRSGTDSAEPVWCDGHENLTLGPARIVRSGAGTFVEIAYCEMVCWQEFLVRSHGRWVYVHGEDPLRSEIDARLRALGYERPFSTNTFVDIDVAKMTTEVAVKRRNDDSVVSALVHLKLAGDRLAVDRLTIKPSSSAE